MESSAYSDKSTNISVEASKSPTLAGAVGTAVSVHDDLNETANFAERLARAIAGPMPPIAASAGESPLSEPSSVTDDLNRRIAWLRDPLFRIRVALERMERAVG